MASKIVKKGGFTIYIRPHNITGYLQLIKKYKDEEGKWRQKSESLGHKNWKKAEKAAEKALNVAISASSEDGKHVERGENLTLGVLFALYLESRKFSKLAESSQTEYKHSLKLILQFFGPDYRVVRLRAKAILNYTDARCAGTHGLNKAKLNTAHKDFKVLRTVVNWAFQEEDATGKRLLETHPLLGFRFDKSEAEEPLQPPLKEFQHQYLLKIAREHEWRIREVFCLVANAWGRRERSNLALRWDHVDFDLGAVYWDPQADKMGHADVVPLWNDLRPELLAWRNERPDTTWVFENPASGKPYSKSMADQWFIDLWALTGMPKPERLAWHGYRRKVITELGMKGWKAEDIMLITGHRNKQSVQNYMKLANVAHARDLMETLGRGRLGDNLVTTDLREASTNTLDRSPNSVSPKVLRLLRHG